MTFKSTLIFVPFSTLIRNYRQKEKHMKRFQKLTLALGLASALTLSLQAKGDVADVTTGTLIPYTSEKAATGDVKEVYAQVKKAFGMVPAPLMQHSVNPQMLKVLWSQFGALHNEHFSPKLQAMMRMTVAASDGLACDYCVGFNEGMLLNMFKMDMKEIIAVKKDPSAAKSLDEKDKKMLIMMVDSARNPKKVNKAQLDDLRKLGWNDKDIFDGIKMATQMVAMTLLVDTLKIPADF